MGTNGTTYITKAQIQEIIQNKKKCFRGMRLHGIDFSGLDLSKADFRSASCHYCNFTNSDCSNANFEGAGLMFTKWQGANCHGMNLKNASTGNADFSGVTDFFGVTVTMDCRTWKGLKLDASWWYGFLFYGLLMEPPSEEDKEKLMLMLGEERFKTLRDLYAARQL